MLTSHITANKQDTTDNITQHHQYKSDKIQASQLFQQALERFQQEGLMTAANARAYRYGRYHATKLTTDGFFEMLKQLLLYISSAAFFAEKEFESVEALRFYGQCCKIQQWHTAWIQNDKKIGHFLLSEAFERLHKEFDELCGGDARPIDGLLNQALGSDLAKELLELIAEKELKKQGPDAIFSLVRTKVETGCYPLYTIQQAFQQALTKWLAAHEENPSLKERRRQKDIVVANGALNLVLATNGVDEGLEKLGLTVKTQAELLQKYRKVEAQLGPIITRDRNSILHWVYTYREVADKFSMDDKTIMHFLQQELSSAGSKSRFTIFARIHAEYRKLVQELQHLHRTHVEQKARYEADEPRRIIWKDTIDRFIWELEGLQQAIQSTPMTEAQLEEAYLDRSEKMEALKTARASYHQLQLVPPAEDNYQEKKNRLLELLNETRNHKVGLTMQDLANKELLDPETLEAMQREKRLIDALYASVDLQGFTVNRKQGYLRYDATALVKPLTTRVQQQWQQTTLYLYTANVHQEAQRLTAALAKKPENISKNWQNLDVLNGQEVQDFTLAAGLPALVGEGDTLVPGNTVSLISSESESESEQELSSSTEYFSDESDSESS